MPVRIKKSVALNLEDRHPPNRLSSKLRIGMYFYMHSVLGVEGPWTYNAITILYGSQWDAPGNTSFCAPSAQRVLVQGGWQ